MTSRGLLVVLAFAAAAYRASQGAWIAAVGLLALGAGLVVLSAAPQRRWLALTAFAVTGVAILASLLLPS